MTTQANGAAAAPVVTAESQVVTSDPVVQSGASDAAKPADAAPVAPAEGAPPAPATPPVDEAAAKQARKEGRKEKVGELSALAQATKARFSETQAMKAAREAADAAAAAAKTSVTEAQTAAQAAQAKLASLKGDPAAVLAFLEAEGLTTDQLSEAILKRASDAGGEGQRKVELAIAEARRIAEEANARADEVVKKYEEGLRAAQQREADAQARANWDAAREAVVATFEKGADSTYEHLDAYVDRLAKKAGASKPAVLVNEFLMTVERLKRDPTFGPVMMSADPYSDDQILAYMNEFYEGIVSPKEKPAAAPADGGASGAPAAAKPALSAKPADAAPDNGKPAPPTLSNAQASEVATSMPDNFDKLSDKEQNRIIVEMMRNGTLPGLTKTT